MSAVAENSHSVVVPYAQDVYRLASGPSPFPGFVFCEAKEQDDGTWKVFFVRKEAMEHSYRELIKKISN